MSQVEILVPAVGESITEATIEEWQKNTGDYVEKNEIIVVLETDKASVELVAEASGVLNTDFSEGDTVEVGKKIGSIDSSAAKPAGSSKESVETPAASSNTPPAPNQAVSKSSSAAGVPGPAAKRVIAENNLNASNISGTGPKGNITKADALNAASSNAQQTTAAETSSKEQAPAYQAPSFESRGTRREKMSTLRKRIAERLVEAQQTAAILTTFNEVDMSAVMSLRSKYKDQFEKKYGIRLGFMGFFVKAVCEALKEYPAVNAQIDGKELIFNEFVNMGIAVGGPKGLVVPVVRDADLMSIYQIEAAIKDYAGKAKNNKLAIDDLTGGTFTISNGGVYGSLMSTPILNPPQSGILGMHKIEKRPIVVGDEVKIRPMMYLALSYDHRVIDGKESVSFLVKIKEALEDPSRLLLGV